jgi:membrane protease YdiL (CAAX protease family)
MLQHGWVRASLYVFAFIIAALVFQVLGILVYGGITGQSFSEVAELQSPQIIFCLQLFGLGGTLLVTYLFCRFIDKRPMQSLGLAYHTPFLKHGLTGLLFGGVLITTGFVILWALGYLQASFSSSTNIGLILLQIAIMVVVSFNEEISMRGYVLNNFSQSIPPGWALLLSSVIFAVFHLLNANIAVLPFISLVLAGILLGVYYIGRKNLWFPIGLHFAWNFFQGPVLGFEVSGNNIGGSIIEQNLTGPNWLTGGSFGFEGSALALPIMVIGMFWVHKFTTNLFKN